MSQFHERYAKIRGEDKVEQLKKEGQLAVLIQRARKEKGLSQQQLAEMIEVPKSTAGRIEAGITTPRLDTLKLLVKALEISITIDGRSNSTSIISEMKSDKATRPTRYKMSSTPVETINSSSYGQQLMRKQKLQASYVVEEQEAYQFGMNQQLEDRLKAAL